MNSEQFSAIVKQAQVRFGCTEEQGAWLARSFAAEVGKRITIENVPGETGLATLRFPDGIDFGTMPWSVRLVRLLQDIEGLYKEGVIPSNSKVQLTPEAETWLRNMTEPPTQAFRPCRFCERPALAGYEVCYICKSEGR